MKKMFMLLFGAVLFVTVKAEKLPYVTVSKTPAETEHISNLRLAMQGKKISGATTNCDADDYKKVWGESLYQRVLNADPDEFTIGVSVGGEKNWGIDKATGLADATGNVLPAGVKTIWLGSVEIAKIGSNYCYNALTPYQAETPGDPDEVDPRSLTSKQKSPAPLQNPNGISITVNGQQAGQDLLWRDLKPVYDQGRNERQNDFIVDASLFKLIQDSKECCGGGGQQMAPTNAIPVAPVSNVSFTQMPAGFQKTEHRFIETFFGQTTANALGTAGGILLVRGVDNLMYRLMYRGGNYYYSPYNGGGSYTGGPVQGGFTSSGVLPYNGGGSGGGAVQGAGFGW